MCTTCNNTGGLTIKHSWGAQFLPCPSSDCDHDREQAIREEEEMINRFRAEIYARQFQEGAV